MVSRSFLLVTIVIVVTTLSATAMIIAPIDASGGSSALSEPLSLLLFGIGLTMAAARLRRPPDGDTE